MSLLYRYKYSIMLVSCVLILISFPIMTGSLDREILNVIIYSLNIIAGLIIINDSQNVAFSRILTAFGLFIILVLLFDLTIDKSLTTKYLPYLYVFYFFFTSVIIYKDIFKAKKISPEMIAAVFCGFILMGLLCAFMLSMVERFNPGSFSGLDSQNELIIDEFVYFSFITLLTIGYGDINPITDVARIITLLVGLLAHFYTVFVTGIVIGKYINRSNFSE